MATILLILIYVIYIGLGVPDSLFGTAWPVIHQEFDLPISMANAVTLLISGGTVISSLLSARVINYFGTPIVTAASTTLTAVALFGFSCSGNLLFLCLFAFPLGLGAGAIDTSLNNYVALHYNASQMSFLHCAYGVGVAISPYLMSVGIAGGAWRRGYLLAFAVQAVISAVAIGSLPVWKRVKEERREAAEQRARLSERAREMGELGTADAASAVETAKNVEGASAGEVVPRNLSIFEMAKMPAVRMTWLMFILSCAIEHTCGIWGSSFLVESKGLSPAIAAKMLIFYYVGLTLGRFLSGLVAQKLTSWDIIHIGYGVLALAVLCFLIPMPGAWLASAGLFLAGLGNGPMYPNLTYLTPIHFGEDISQSVIGSQMAFSYVGIMMMPTLFGFLAQLWSTDLFPYYIGVLFALFVAAMVWLKRALRRDYGVETIKLQA